MKKTAIFKFLGLLLLIIVASCSKEELIVDSPKGQSNLKTLEVLTLPDYCNVTPIVFDLMAGQTMDVGSVTIGNDEEYLYITYETIDGWMLDEIHVFVGDLADVPTNKQNTPVPGYFPYIVEDIYASSYTLAIPLSELEDLLDECPVILTHASVVKGDMDETAWGWDGDESHNFEDTFGTSRWGYLGYYCFEECDGPDPETKYLTLKGKFMTSSGTDAFTALGDGIKPYSNPEVWCYNLGLVEIVDNTYDLLLGYGQTDQKVGTVNIEVTESEIIITFDLLEPELFFYTSYVFYGTLDELATFSHTNGCPNFWAFPQYNLTYDNQQITILR